MEYTLFNNTPGLLMLIDFEKAFDSISWSFIHKIDWVNILNTYFKSAILQSGHLSDQISIQRGCRQGDPVSPYLFIFCAEILSILIKQNKEIKGVIINNKEYKLIQYADDTSLTHMVLNSFC